MWLVWTNNIYVNIWREILSNKTIYKADVKGAMSSEYMGYIFISTLMSLCANLSYIDWACYIFNLVVSKCIYICMYMYCWSCFNVPLLHKYFEKCVIFFDVIGEASVGKVVQQLSSPGELNKSYAWNGQSTSQIMFIVYVLPERSKTNCICPCPHFVDTVPWDTWTLVLEKRIKCFN